MGLTNEPPSEKEKLSKRGTIKSLFDGEFGVNPMNFLRMAKESVEQLVVLRYLRYPLLVPISTQGEVIHKLGLGIHF